MTNALDHLAITWACSHGEAVDGKVPFGMLVIPTPGEWDVRCYFCGSDEQYALLLAAVLALGQQKGLRDYQDRDVLIIRALGMLEDGEMQLTIDHEDQ